jgi:hypothetical protein
MFSLPVPHANDRAPRSRPRSEERRALTATASQPRTLETAERLNSLFSRNGCTSSRRRTDDFVLALEPPRRETQMRCIRLSRKRTMNYERESGLSRRDGTPSSRRSPVRDCRLLAPNLRRRPYPHRKPSTPFLLTFPLSRLFPYPLHPRTLRPALLLRRSTILAPLLMTLIPLAT